MQIRAATERDIGAISGLYWQSDCYHADGEPYVYQKTDHDFRSVDYITSIINDQQSIFVVAELDGRICGFAYGYIEIKGNLPIHRQRKTFVLDNIVVDQEHQNQGCGALLLRSIIEAARGLQCDDVSLNVYSFNQRALVEPRTIS
jgi:diamine N-acetyltransferase